MCEGHPKGITCAELGKSEASYAFAALDVGSNYMADLKPADMETSNRAYDLELLDPLDALHEFGQQLYDRSSDLTSRLREGYLGLKQDDVYSRLGYQGTPENRIQLPQKTALDIPLEDFLPYMSKH